ncbi:MAG: CDP-alcohol phosphatidyltransferase family protein [Spirochaetia bacterium]
MTKPYETHLFLLPSRMYLPHGVSNWDGRYLQWDRGFSAGMALLGVAVVVCSNLDGAVSVLCRALIALATTGWAVGGLFALYRSVPRHTIADRITTIRLGLGSAAMLLLAFAQLFAPLDSGSTGFRLVVFLLLGVALLSDFLDGRVARRRETSRFGEEWDMQNDAAFAMLLSVAAVVFVGVESWVVVIGLARYLFVLGVPGSHDAVHTPRPYALFGKTVCALTVITLALVVAGGWAGTPATLSLAAALFATLSSFAVSIYLLRRERETTYIPASSHAPERVHTSVE